MLLLLLVLVLTFRVHAAEVFIYSSQSEIRGLDLSAGSDRLLTSSPVSSGVNALAYNLQAGIVYYGTDTSVYRWDPALGSGPSAHVLMNDFSVGPLTAPVTNIDSTAGSFLNGKYYVGSESNAGYIQDLYELTMSVDGTQVVSIRPLDLLTACACTEVQLGGFGDVAAILEGGQVVLYGSSADLSGSGQGTSSGRWKFSPDTASFQLLSAGSGGQMSVGPTGTLYSNVGNSVREVDKLTGAISGTSLMTTSAAIYDFTGGFSLDYGDAPDSYGSAFHRLTQSTGAWIGALGPDNEAGTLNAIAGLGNGAGDDVDGVDDEDAIAATVSISALVSDYSLTVQCSAGARVAGWIDSNINGVFDTSERNYNHPVTCTAGQATLAWSGLLAATAGNTYLRLRASVNAAAVSEPTGIASDGEVEDHPVTITGGSANSGSCPANSTSYTYNAGDLPITIGPNANTTAVSTISVSDAGTLVDVNVLDVTGTHTYINDLYFDLTHAGTSRRLYGPSCGSQNNFSFGFDDGATGTPPCPPTDGNTYPAQQALSSFNGQQSTGDWQLRIVDRFNGDAGTLTNWQLELCVSGNVANEAPNLTLGKHATIDDQQVNLQFTVRNSGNVELENVSIVDDLDSVFGNGNYSIVSSPVLVEGPASASVNTTFNGSTQTQLLAPSTTLATGEQLVVQVFVQVDVIAGGSNPGLYSNQAIASATSGSGTSVNDLSGPGLDVNNDIDQPTVFQLDVSATLAGAVFFDTSGDSTTAHDGVRNTTEEGVSGRLIQILNSSGDVLAATSTDATGNWQVSIDAEFLEQILTVSVQGQSDTSFVSEASAFSTGSVTDGVTQLSVTYAESITGLDTGVVSIPILQADRSSSVAPGATVIYAHTFFATTHGVVTYDLVNSTTTTEPDWNRVLWIDNNCDGQVDPLDSLATTPQSVTKDETHCLLSVQTVPLTAANGDIAQTSLTAQFSVADVSAIGHGLQFSQSNLDVTTVIRAVAGRLELGKSVRNITRGDVEAIYNAATPGQTLEYRIQYSNTGNGPLTELLVQDSAPPFTSIVPGSTLCTNTPASLSCAPATDVNAVSWTFSGTLAAGASGHVSYRVVVD